MKHRADQPKHSEYHLQRAESCLLRHARLSVALCQEIFSAAVPHKAGGDIKRRAAIVVTMSISDARDFLAAELVGGGGKGHNGNRSRRSFDPEPPRALGGESAVVEFAAKLVDDALVSSASAGIA
jgi:hypothetical protein